MAKPPLSGVDQQKVGQFVGKLLRGVVDLGLSSLPLVSLYQTAKEQRISVIDLALQDEDTVRTIVEALRRRAKLLPLPVLSILREAVAAAGHKPAQPVPTAGLTDDDAP